MLASFTVDSAVAEIELKIRGSFFKETTIFFSLRIIERPSGRGIEGIRLVVQVKLSSEASGYVLYADVLEQGIHVVVATELELRLCSKARTNGGHQTSNESTKDSS